MIQDSLLNVLAGNYENIYIACGRTDLRKGIDGLVAIIQTEFKLNPYSSAMFLFCGNRADKIKAIVYDIEGFTLLYKRLEHGQFKWPRNSNDAMQLNLFNEAEAFARENEEEPVLEEVKAHYRKKRISAKDRLPEDMPIEVIEHKLNVEETNCPQCKQELHEIGKEVVREELKIIPAKAVIVRHMRYSYGCRNCERNDVVSPVRHLFRIAL